MTPPFIFQSKYKKLILKKDTFAKDKIEKDNEKRNLSIGSTISLV